MTPKQRKARFDALAEYGCVICRMPPQIHHLKGYEFGSSMGKKAPDEMTIPLCMNHHEGKNGFHHLGKETWEKQYGTQRYWLNEVNKRLGL